MNTLYIKYASRLNLLFKKNSVSSGITLITLIISYEKKLSFKCSIFLEKNVALFIWLYGVISTIQ